METQSSKDADMHLASRKLPQSKAAEKVYHWPSKN